ncbi:unnamed protein product [Trifolium pratense]|uniref:Uncharacterized protein n=1 Tax=Trifolium pratense TaxID=57577 RepID=A0ACB0KRZ8_TRIPR|nr:unnamed protein product [Trifolium pratense]
MRMKLNREPTCFEVYQRMHKPKEKSNEWFNKEQALIASDKVAATETKMEALIVELEQNNLEQEMLKQKMEHCEQIFGRFVPSINQNSSVQLEREGDKENYEIDANENDVMDDED